MRNTGARVATAVRRTGLATAVCCAGLLAACRSVPEEPLPTVERVELSRFMGDWYVIASIPTVLERGAHNAVESYTLRADGRVATRFRFRDGGFDGPLRLYEPTGYVRDATGAVWGMQFLWPLRAEYRVIFLDEAYQRTVIGRTRRDYVWLMARDPVLSPTAYEEMVAAVAAAGYDTARLRRVPQRWPEEPGSGD